MSLPVKTLTTSFAEILQSQKNLSLGMIHVSNFSGSAATVSFCEVRAGEEPGEGNSWLWGFTVPANDFIEFGGGMVLRGRAVLQGKASANSAINVKISYT